MADLFRGQSKDGLWRGSPIETIHRLFGLHLTVRNPDPRINQGLDKLLRIASSSGEHFNFIPSSRLRGLPFTQGPRQAIILLATLFLCSIFGRAAAPFTLARYDQMTIRLNTETLSREKPAAVHNMLRAFVVHPTYVDLKYPIRTNPGPTHTAGSAAGEPAMPPPTMAMRMVRVPFAEP